MLDAGLVEHADHGGWVVDVIAAGNRDEGALRQVRHGRAVLAGPDGVAGVDRRRGQPAGLRRVAAVPGPPDLAGFFVIGFGGGASHPADRTRRTTNLQG